MLSKRLHGGPGSEELRQLIAPALKVSFFSKKKKTKNCHKCFCQAYLVEGGVLPESETSTPSDDDPWSEVWDKLDAAIKKTFGRALNVDDVERAKSTAGGWEGEHL